MSISSQDAGREAAVGHRHRPEPLGGVRVQSPGDQQHRDGRAQPTVQEGPHQRDAYVSQALLPGPIPALFSMTECGLKLLFKLNKTLMLLQPHVKHLCSHQAEQTLHILIPKLKRYMNILTGPTLLRQLRG